MEPSGCAPPQTEVVQVEQLIRVNIFFEEVQHRREYERELFTALQRTEEMEEDRREVRRATVGLDEGEEDLPESIFPWRQFGWRTPTPTESLMESDEEEEEVDLDVRDAMELDETIQAQQASMFEFLQREGIPEHPTREMRRVMERAAYHLQPAPVSPPLDNWWCVPHNQNLPETHPPRALGPGRDVQCCPPCNRDQSPMHNHQSKHIQSPP